MKLRASFLLKRNKIDKPLARIRQKRKESEMKEETFQLITHTPRIIKNWYEQLYTNN